MKATFLFLISTVLLFSQPQSVMGKGQESGDSIDTQTIYIEGTVMDEQGNGLSNVDIVIELQNDKSMSLRTKKDGSFKSRNRITVPDKALEVKMTLTKPGYQFTEKTITINKENHKLTFKLPVIHNIYVAGFVQDVHGNGLSEVDITIEHQNRKLMSLRTIEDGWFESPRRLNVPINDEVRITLMKPGYKFTQKTETIIKENHIFTYSLSALPYYPPIHTSEEHVTLPLYGFIRKPDADGGGGLAGAEVTLQIDAGKAFTREKPKNVVDIAISRDSGFFTLYYKSSLRESDKKFTYRIEHPDYNIVQGTVKLAQQSKPLEVLDLEERYFDIAWLARVGFAIPPDREKIGGYAPISAHINLLRLSELVFNYDLVPPTKRPEWSLYLSNYKTKETNVGALMLGASWKPLGVSQSNKTVLDTAMGASVIGIHKESRHIYKAPHIQFGVSYYYRKTPYGSFAAPHVRLGFAIYEDHIGWNYLIEFNFLGI